MKASAFALLCSLVFCAAPAFAQDEMGEIIVTAQMRNSVSGGAAVIQQPPVIGLKRQADSAVRTIEIVSDSRDEDMRKREVQAMLFAAIDRAKAQGFSLVTGQFELVEVTRANWQDQFPGLAIKAEDKDDEDEDAEDDNDDNDDNDDDNKPPPAFEDDNSTTTIRLKVKTKLNGSIGNAQLKISSFIKAVPKTGRSQIVQKGGLALTIINPEQYRDQIYSRIAGGSKHAVTFYGPDYGLTMTGLDKAIAWKQVSNTEVFLYIPYAFTIEK
jgi:hypothetical protein